MANGTIVITVKTARSQTDNAARFIKDTTNPRAELRSLQHLFERGAAGLEPMTVDVQTSSVAPVKATQTATLTYASISNNDTVVVAGITLTCVTGTPVGAQFKKVTDATVTAANLVALVNSLATLNIYVKAANVAGVVTFTSLVPGKIGNFLTLVGSTGIVAGAATFSGGLGGAETVAVNYKAGL